MVSRVFPNQQNQRTASPLGLRNKNGTVNGRPSSGLISVNQRQDFDLPLSAMSRADGDLGDSPVGVSFPLVL